MIYVLTWHGLRRIYKMEFTIQERTLLLQSIWYNQSQVNIDMDNPHIDDEIRKFLIDKLHRLQELEGKILTNGK